MLKTQFDFLCETFGDQSLDIKDRWKSVKYIFNENPLGDMQLLIKRNEAVYIDNDEMGAGFCILGTPDVELNPVTTEKTITFLPLSQIDKITFVSDNIEVTETNESNNTNIPVTSTSQSEVNGIIVTVS